MSPTPTISNDLKAVLRQVKLGRCLDTLPERLALAKTRNLSHAEFLELVLSDEVTRRETTSAALRARAAGLDPDMSLDHWDDTTNVTFDHQTWNELCSLRFIDAGHNVMIMGPVGVGKTFMATALGHAAVRRRYTVIAERTDILLKQLRASRLDNSHEAELRKLLRVDLLILDLCRPGDYPDTVGLRAAGSGWGGGGCRDSRGGLSLPVLGCVASAGRRRSWLERDDDPVGWARSSSRIGRHSWGGATHR